jgi:hypothetical protein
VIKRLIDFENTVWETLVERVSKKYPEHFWNAKPLKGLSLEARILNLWPGIMAFNYWYYLFHDLEGKEWWGSDRYENWINIPAWGEIRYLFQGWNAKEKKYTWQWNPKWVWIQLTDETKGRRLLCRIRNHPEGEIYWNPGGDEPDHRCQTCGESIG